MLIGALIKLPLDIMFMFCGKSLTVIVRQLYHGKKRQKALKIIFIDFFKLPPDFFWLIHPIKLLIRANTV